MLKRSSKWGGGRNLRIEFIKLSTESRRTKVSKGNQVTVIIKVGESQKSVITGLIKDWS